MTLSVANSDIAFFERMGIMVGKMQHAFNGLTTWVRDKLLPWMVITTLVTIGTMVVKLSALENKVNQFEKIVAQQNEVVNKNIELAVEKAMAKMLENQQEYIMENMKDIARLETCINANTYKIETLLKK